MKVPCGGRVPPLDLPHSFGVRAEVVSQQRMQFDAVLPIEEQPALAQLRNDGACIRAKRLRECAERDRDTEDRREVEKTQFLVRQG